MRLIFFIFLGKQILLKIRWLVLTFQACEKIQLIRDIHIQLVNFWITSREFMYVEKLKGRFEFWIIFRTKGFETYNKLTHI